MVCAWRRRLATWLYIKYSGNASEGTVVAHGRCDRARSVDVMHQYGEQHQPDHHGDTVCTIEVLQYCTCMRSTKTPVTTELPRRRAARDPAKQPGTWADIAAPARSWRRQVGARVASSRWQPPGWLLVASPLPGGAAHPEDPPARSAGMHTKGQSEASSHQWAVARRLLPVSMGTFARLSVAPDSEQTRQRRGP